MMDANFQPNQGRADDIRLKSSILLTQYYSQQSCIT
jgi:hypothetical protein